MMKIFIKRSFLFILPILLFNCSKDTITEETFKIKFGTECGWCGGQEYIYISKTKIEYERNIPCGDDMGNTVKSRNLNSKEWDEVNGSFDYSLFKTLEYTNCNVCVDGCDEIIEITKGESINELRFSFSDQVEGMENLRKILSDILIEMRELD